MNDFIIAEIQRALLNMIRIGKIVQLDPQNARCRVELDGLTTAWLPWQSSAAGKVRVWRVPSVGEQVLVLSPAGDQQRAIVFAGFPSDQFPPVAGSEDIHRMAYDDGTVIEYDMINKILNVETAGDIVLSASSITLNGVVNINGTLASTGDTVAAGVSVVRHQHGGVQAGSGMTGIPA